MLTQFESRNFEDGTNFLPAALFIKLVYASFETLCARVCEKRTHEIRMYTHGVGT